MSTRSTITITESWVFGDILTLRRFRVTEYVMFIRPAPERGVLGGEWFAGMLMSTSAGGLRQKSVGQVAYHNVREWRKA